MARNQVRCEKTGVIFDVGVKRIFVEDIKTLTNAQIDALECGDMVVKKTGKMKHTYFVTYKEEKHGICLSYFDATGIETQSYDYINGVWTYNSEDKGKF